MTQLMNDRLVLNDLNARSELEVIDSIYERAIITTNSANIINIMVESTPVNPEEEVIRRKGRKKTPKISSLPLRRSPRKAPNHSANHSPDASQTEQTHDYYLRTPKKTPQKSPQKCAFTRTPKKALFMKTPSKRSPTKQSAPKSATLKSGPFVRKLSLRRQSLRRL